MSERVGSDIERLLISIVFFPKNDNFNNIAYIELNSENFSFSNFGYSRQFFSKILKIFVDFQDFSLQNKKNQKLLGIQSKF